MLIRRELEPGLFHEREQLLVRRRLAELPVRLGRVEAVLAREAHGLDDRVRGLLDRHLLVLPHGEDERLDRVVVAQHPHEELREVARIDELPQRLPGAPNDERVFVLCMWSGARMVIGGGAQWHGRRHMSMRGGREE